jgi:hypothetical protein
MIGRSDLRVLFARCGDQPYVYAALRTCIDLYVHAQHKRYTPKLPYRADVYIS